MKNFGLICSLCKHASALQNRKDCLLFCMCRATFQDNFILCMYKKGVWVQLIFFLSVLFSSLCVVLVLKIKLAVYKPLLENLISLLVSVLLFIFDGFLC